VSLGGGEVLGEQGAGMKRRLRTTWHPDRSHRDIF
jgi:hypothetical protein